MIKKILSTFIFLTAIGCGIGVGYGTTQIVGTTYHTLVAYASELKVDMQKEHTKDQPSLGGPEAETIIESDFNQNSQKNAGSFEIKSKGPKVTAASYLVADLETGKVLSSKNINQQLPIASVTKLMTAVVADETLGLDTKTTIDMNSINTYGTQGDLKKGETYSILELFYPLLLESSNDAGEAIASTKNRTSFIADMNGKARSLGLSNTSYEDASGLSSNNMSTVTDLFRLTQYISKYREYLFDISIEKKKELGKKTWFSNSRFRSDSDYVGGKNGYTDEALKTQVVLFEEDFEKNERVIVYIVLRSTDVANDVKALRQFVHSSVEYK